MAIQPRRIPTAADVSGPVSLRPSGSNPGIDTDAIYSGAQALAGGLQQLSGGVEARGKIIENRQRTADVAAADAMWLKGSLDIGTRFENDGNYGTFDKRVTGDTAKLKEEAAAAIRDPETRQRWLEATELKRISLISAVNEKGMALSDDADRAKLTSAIDGLSKVIADPNTPEVTRAAARKSIAQSLQVAQGSGLFSPSQAATLRKAGLDGGEEQLALNRANFGIEYGDPTKVLKGLNIDGSQDAIAPEYKALTFEQRLALGQRAQSKIDELDVKTRADLEIAKVNAPAAIANTGLYDQPMPTIDQFVKAYGAQRGPEEFKAFEGAIDVASAMHGFRTMPSDQILSTVEEATPTSTGDGAAVEADKFDKIHAAAKSTLEAREKDPAGYVMGVFPNVAAAFEAASDDPTKTAQALTMMQAAQEQLGIHNPQLLPKQTSADAVATFNDRSLPVAQRIAGVTHVILSTGDAAQQDMIFDQLVEDKLPPMMAGVFSAMRRGDQSGAVALMAAATFDPNSVKVTMPSGQKDEDIKTRLLEDVFGPGDVGDIVYGVQGPGEIGAAADASELLFNDVKLRLTNGSAKDLDSAVEMAKRDLFGDVQTITGKGGALLGIGAGVGVKVTAPKGTDPNVVRQGFNNLAPDVRRVLRDYMIGDGLPQNLSDGSALTVQMGVEQYVDAVMADGFFTNADGFLPAGQTGYVFFDPKRHTAVPDKTGKPMVFSLDDVVGAARPGDSYDSRY